MERTLKRVDVVSKEVVKQSVIALSVTAVYMVLCNINPASALVGIPALSFVASIRLSNLLRPLVLRYYGAAFGIAMGSYLFSVQSGKVLLGAYSVMPVIMLGVSIFFYGLAKAWGRSLLKDLTLIALYGFVAGVIVSLNLVAVSMLLNGTVWSKLLQTAIQYKVLLHVLISLAGYPILKLVEGLYEKNPSSK